MLHLGGQHDEIEPLNFSIYNFNNNFNSDLQSLGGDFYYFIVSSDDYIYGRTKNIWYNWQYVNDKESPAANYKLTKMSYKLSNLKAKQELASYPETQFLTNIQDFTPHIYTFGVLSKDLDVINTTDSEELNEEKVISADSIESSPETEEKRLTIKN